MALDRGANSRRPTRLSKSLSFVVMLSVVEREIVTSFQNTSHARPRRRLIEVFNRGGYHETKISEVSHRFYLLLSNSKCLCITIDELGFSFLEIYVKSHRRCNFL